MVNPHDTPSPHSGDWDEREKADERSSSRPSGGSGYSPPPTDWSNADYSNTYRSYNTGTGPEYVPQKGRSRKIAAIIITILSVAVIGIFLFGDGSFDSLTWIFILLDDIIEQISDTIQPCKVYNSIQITKVASEGTISLMSCSIENKDVLTVSGDLSKSAQDNLTFFNPDMKKIQEVTFVKKEFSQIIGKELYSKDAGEWRINVIVSGKLQGVLKFIAN